MVNRLIAVTLMYVFIMYIGLREILAKSDFAALKVSAFGFGTAILLLFFAIVIARRSR